MTSIPTTRPVMEWWCLPNFSAVGNNSSNEMKIITPAIADSTKAFRVRLQNGNRKKNAISAPTGSANPDENESQNAFFLLPVE